MLPELLVILACSQNKGCAETSSFYYKTHPTVQKIVKKPEKIAKEYLGPKIIHFATPLIFFTLGGTASFRLTNNYSLQINEKSATIFFRRDF